MRNYPCRKEVTKEFIREKMQVNFGNVEEVGDKLVSSFPPLNKIEVTISKNKEIGVETISGNTGNPELAVKVFNKFLEDVTGYSAKERKKMAMKL